MEFYKLRKQALQKIDELYNDNVPETVILFKLSSELGIGERMIKKRIELLKQIFPKREK